MRAFLFFTGVIIALLSLVAGGEVTVQNGIIGVIYIVLGMGVGFLLIGLSEVIRILEKLAAK